MAYTYEQVHPKTRPWPFFNFTEYNDELVTHSYHTPILSDGQILSTSDGDTWSELFRIDATVSGIAPQGGGNTDYDLIVYDGSLWIGQYEGSVYYTNARILEWDGTSITQHLNSVAQNNILAWSLIEWAGRLWCVTDITPFASDGCRIVYHYTRGAGWTAITDYDGAGYILYNKYNVLLEDRFLHSKLVTFRGGLYFIATRWDSVNSKWGWQVWQFETATWTSFKLIYETYDDYVFSDVIVYGSKALLFANQVTATGVAKSEAKFYSSYNMLNWSEDGEDATLGLVCGLAIYNAQVFLNCLETVSDRARIYTYSLTTKSATLEEEITTYTFASATGGAIVWESDLYIGKSREIMRRTPREAAGTEDDESEKDKIVTLTKWTFKAADGTTIDYRIAPIDVSGPDAFYEGRLLSMSGAERSTDDRTGLPAVGDMTVEIANHDKAISIILNSYPIWKNQIMQAWYAKRNKPEALKSDSVTMVVVDYYEKGPNYVVLLKDMNRKYFDIMVPEEIAT